MIKFLCIDYDVTITDNRNLLEAWIGVAKILNYTIIICTARSQDESNDDLLNYAKSFKVFFTNGEKKSIFLSKFDIYPDLWVDDAPWTI